MCIHILSFLIHSSIDRHLSCFHILAMNMGVQISLSLLILLPSDIFPKVSLLNHVAGLFLYFEESPCCFS